MSKLDPSKDKRLYMVVLDRMLQLLDSGEYPIGGRLPPERELAERFCVSRPTIREAMIALETLKRVQIRSGSGVYVLSPSTTTNEALAAATAFELTEARALIEGEAAALAATLISESELAALEVTLSEMAVETRDGRLISELADKKFHHQISRATGNVMMAAVFDSLWHVRDNSPEVSAAYQAICEVDVQARYQEHRAIFDALKARDPAAARSAMHRHFSRILEKLIIAKETAQVDFVRREAEKSRKRFSLSHLAR